jgi:lysophospholipase L1-like esterase
MPWYAPASLGAVAAGVLAVGLGLGLSGRVGERVGPAPAVAAAPAPRADVYRIAALGDSITAGTGEGRGGGYAARLGRMLGERGRRVDVVNRAVPGAETGDVLARLREPGVRDAVARASLVVVSASGNDLTHTFRPTPGRELGDPDVALPRVRANLRALVARLRAVNPTAPIRLVGLYNPFDVAPADEAAARAQLAVWNAAIEEAADGTAGALAVPVADLFYQRPDRLAADHYHPGPRGHELIAARVLETLREGDDRPAEGARGD